MDSTRGDGASGVAAAREDERGARSGLERLLVAVEVARIGTWEWRADAGEVVLCPRAAEIAGLDAGPQGAGREREVRGHPLSAVLPLLHPEDVPAARTAVLAALLHPEGSFSLRCRLLRASDGCERTVRLEGRVVPGDAAVPDRALGALLDLTDDEQREQERRRLLDEAVEARLAAERATSELESVLARMHDAVFSLDRDLRVTYVNDACVHDLRLPRERLVGSLFFDLFPDGRGGQLDRELRVALASGGSRSFEVYYAPWDDTTLVRVYPTADGLIVFSTNVSTTRRALRALEEREEQLRLALATARLVRWEWDLRTNIVSRDAPGAALLAVEPVLTLEQFIARVHPDDREPWLAAFQQAVATGGDLVVEYRIVGEDGVTRWVLSRGRTSRHDEQGRPLALTGVSVDATPLWRAESELRTARHRLEALTEANVLGVAVGRGDVVLHANDFFLGLLGRTRDELEAGGIVVSAQTPPEHLAVDQAGYAQLLESGTMAPFEKEFVLPDGTRVPVLVGAALVDREAEEWMAFALDLTERRRAEERLATLQRLTAALARALTRRQIARASLEAGVDALGAVAGTFTVLDAARESLEVVQWFGWHAGALSRGQRIPLRQTTVEARAIAAGEPFFCRTREEVLRASAGFEQVVEAVGAGSIAGLPLRAGERVLGVLLLAFAEERSFDAADRDMLGSIAELSAQALLRGMRYEAEREIAVTLQRSIIPASLPVLEGIELEAAYLPAGESAEVGGDWYDVFPLGDDRVVLAIGDVAGKGVPAASAMAQFRNALRAYAVDGLGPSAVLERLNRLSALMPDAPFATVQVAYLARKSGEVRYASAGHPPAAVRAAGGQVAFVERGRGTPIGAGPASRYGETELRLGAGDALVLYTDGLVERRTRPLDDGFDRLASALSEAPSGPNGVVPHLLRRLVASGRAEDDVAILVARRQG